MIRIKELIYNAKVNTREIWIGEYLEYNGRSDRDLPNSIIMNYEGEAKRLRDEIVDNEVIQNIRFLRN